ncbi:hypothetical protein A9Q99_25065 [Gammaproteobacteria bacterium 45_16_T64]|nr:hypothetical protein A9Q99_25065 [Gammaproteobacteria bacterium 45_16_T64]
MSRDSLFSNIAGVMCLLLWSTLSSIAQAVDEVTLKAPTSIVAGGKVVVHWVGPNNPRDYITIVKPTARASAYNQYKYTRDGTPLSINAPQVPGIYEVRYNSETEGTVLGRASIEIVASKVGLETPSTAKSGAMISVIWEGPNNQGDYITVVKKGAAPGTWTQYVYTYKGNPVQLRMPDQAGEYEVRYATEQARITLAANPITISANSATLTAPVNAVAGSIIDVNWTGPDNPKDYITVVPKGAKEGTWNHYQYTKTGNPIPLQVPDDAGDYEIRYSNGQSYSTLAVIPLVVKPASASVKAANSVIADEPFSVEWQGPNNKGDYVTIVPVDAKEGVWGSYTYTKRGSPLMLMAPELAGKYEIRYSTGQRYKTLARKQITVGPGNKPGYVQVKADETQFSTSEQQETVALILDASGSMLKKQDGVSRIDIAKHAILNLTNNVLAEGTPFTMRVFGHKEADSCRTDLEMPLQPLNRKQVITTVNGINAMNLAKTPIAKSLSLVKSDTDKSKGPVTVILLTDGEETCQGNPKSAIEALVASGVNVRINIVGFAINEYVLKNTFTQWAQLGNGRYYEASNQEELSRSLLKATEKNYQLVDGSGKVIATGLINGEKIAIAPGTYQLTSQYLSGKPRDVIVKPDGLSVEVFPATQ